MGKIPSNCEYCLFYEYDEEDECYYCTKDLDEDEMAHFLAGHHFECPFFQYGNEYSIVKKQM
ncbi:MAG: DUF6472 family protein [Lachnospiraceae bacterium]|nr:DUF6472 family protein [Lachnospiraceae bacterium]